MNRQETAETVALQALGWLLGQPEELSGFLAASGASPGDLAHLAGEPQFLAALVDYLLETDARVLACSADLGLPPEALGAARQALPGGRDPHWT